MNTRRNVKPELFNLNKDPFEKHDLSGECPEQVKQLQALLEQERSRDSHGIVKGVE
jgi:hypothetical protein